MSSLNELSNLNTTIVSVQVIFSDVKMPRIDEFKYNHCVGSRMCKTTLATANRI